MRSSDNNEKMVLPTRLRDALGRAKVTVSQNIYDVDFEYGKQPLRWEEFTAGSGTITHLPGEGGVRMRLTTANGDITIRQSRPYHRYQPGKTMFMSSAVNFGPAQTNQLQRVGFFDDSNGIFIQQGDPTTDNPFGMSVVIRDDINAVPADTVTPIDQWNGDPQAKLLDWTRIQMVWMEYAWYGAGVIKWGAMLNGEPILLHTYGHANFISRTGTASSQAWSRTGNLPVRYEQRNIGVTALQNDMVHYGVSVMVDGRVDDQRGNTFSYGTTRGVLKNIAAASTQVPVLSIRMRNMGTIEYTQASSAITAGTTTSLTATGTPWVANQWVGRFVAYVVAGVTYTARITSNTTGVLTLVDVVTGGALAVAPVAGQNYTIGLINRGQILPRLLTVSSTSLATIEVFLSTPTNPIVLTSPSWTALTTLGSPSSFAERDISATAMTGGEKVKSVTLIASSSTQLLDLSFLFALYTNIKGNTTDILTLAVTSVAGTTVGADFEAQEAMS